MRPFRRAVLAFSQQVLHNVGVHGNDRQSVDQQHHAKERYRQRIFWVIAQQRRRERDEGLAE